MDSHNPESCLYLSDQRTLYIGQMRGVVSLSKASAMLFVSAGEDLEVLDYKGRVVLRSKSLLTPVDCQIMINSHKEVLGICVLDFLGNDFSALSKNMTGELKLNPEVTVYSGHKDEKNLIDLFSLVMSQHPPAEIVFNRLENWIGGPSKSYSIDQRVSKAIHFIQENSAREIKIEDIAEAANLSVPRLTQLFRQETGINIRRFKMWNRIYLTTLRYAEGLSLTDAAIEAGFSDYAHFSRAYSEMSGISPSQMLSGKSLPYIDVLGSQKYSGLRAVE